MIQDPISCLWTRAEMRYVISFWDVLLLEFLLSFSGVWTIILEICGIIIISFVRIGLNLLASFISNKEIISKFGMEWTILAN